MGGGWHWFLYNKRHCCRRQFWQTAKENNCVWRLLSNPREGRVFTSFFFSFGLFASTSLRQVCCMKAVCGGDERWNDKQTRGGGRAHERSKDLKIQVRGLVLVKRTLFWCRQPLYESWQGRLSRQRAGQEENVATRVVEHKRLKIHAVNKYGPAAARSIDTDTTPHETWVKCAPVFFSISSLSVRWSMHGRCFIRV